MTNYGDDSGGWNAGQRNSSFTFIPDATSGPNGTTQKQTAVGCLHNGVKERVVMYSV